MCRFLQRLAAFELRATGLLFFSLFCVALAVFTTLIAFYAYKFGVLGFGAYLSADPGHWGVLGDFLGGVLNPILTLLSFGALIFTLLVQIKQSQNQQASTELDSVNRMIIRTDDEIAAGFSAGAPWQKLRIPDKPEQPDKVYDAREYRTLQNANRLRLLLKWMHRALLLDPDSPLVSQICEKHGSYVRKIHAKGWVSAELESFFTKRDVASQHATQELERELEGGERD